MLLLLLVVADSFMAS